MESPTDEVKIEVRVSDIDTLEGYVHAAGEDGIGGAMIGMDYASLAAMVR